MDTERRRCRVENADLWDGCTRFFMHDIDAISIETKCRWRINGVYAFRHSRIWLLGFVRLNIGKEFSVFEVCNKLLVFVFAMFGRRCV